MWRSGRTGRVLAAVVVVAAIGACGGGGGSDGGASSSATTATAGSPVTTAKGGPEVPAFLADFERVCTTQVGYPGVSAYEEAPGLHPVVLFEDYRGEGLVESGRTLPDGWAVKQDNDFKDTSDLQAAQLVACSDRVEEQPTGVMCDFEDDGKTVKLELVDAVYDVKIYTATSGELKGEQKLEAHDSTCPYIATFKKGDKTYVNQPSDDDYINALKALVAR